MIKIIFTKQNLDLENFSIDGMSFIEKSTFPMGEGMYLETCECHQERPGKLVVVKEMSYEYPELGFTKEEYYEFYSIVTPEGGCDEEN